MTMAARKEAFDAAMRLARPSLPAHARDWTLEETVAALRRAISENTPPADKNKIRHFTVNVLRLRGETFVRVRKWMKGADTLEESALVAILRNVACANPPAGPAAPAAPVPVRPDLNAGVVTHVVSTMNSLSGLVSKTGIVPSDAYDGDRMQMKSAIEKLCRSFGLEAVIEPVRARNVPVTQADLTSENPQR